MHWDVHGKILSVRQKHLKGLKRDCQAIQNKCITNGTTCDDAKPCNEYTKGECEINPKPVSPHKCKLDGDTFRYLKCSEADNTMTTNNACDTWLDGCLTTGYGCININLNKSKIFQKQINHLFRNIFKSMNLQNIFL